MVLPPDSLASVLDRHDGREARTSPAVVGDRWSAPPGRAAGLAERSRLPQYLGAEPGGSGALVAPQFVEKQGQFLLGVHPEFPEHRGQVVPDGGLGDEQLLGDARHVVTGQQQPDHLRFPVGQHASVVQVHLAGLLPVRHRRG